MDRVGAMELAVIGGCKEGALARALVKMAQVREIKMAVGVQQNVSQSRHFRLCCFQTVMTIRSIREAKLILLIGSRRFTKDPQMYPLGFTGLTLQGNWHNI